MNKIFLRHIPLFIFFLLSQSVSGKTRHSTPFSSITSPVSKYSSENVKALEDRFRPILEQKVSRAKRTRGITANLVHIMQEGRNGPSDNDFLMLVQVWNNLSPEFKTLYKMATLIPNSFLTFVSPGGHFEISYTLDGIDAVDPTDNYGFSTSNWRIKQELENGIPDYIDEVAWALDSSWSVQIDQFDLTPPIPFHKSDTSDRYVVIVENQQYQDIYGLTWVGVKSSEASRGYSSYISLRNEWPTSQWQHLGYDIHPELGIRVTCAHEFFHAIHYSMSWNVISRDGLLCLDNFPLSWIEGTATAMEEFLFKDINDYLQYANMYFSRPGMSFLNGSNDVYTNAILILYLLKETSRTNENFVTLVHKDNYASPVDFHQYINSAALSYGYHWVELLNSFHTASFFTGAFADTNRFLNDAPLYSHWSFQDTRSPRFGLQKSINPYAMEKFYIKPESSDKDTLWVLLNNEQADQKTSLEKSWAVSVIIKEETEEKVIPVQIDTSGNGYLYFAGWKNADYAITVVTNGHPDLKRSYSVWFEFSDVAYRSESTYTFYPQVTDSTAWITLKTKTDLRGKLQIDSENDLQNFIPPDSLKQIGTAYNINIPGAWNSNRYKNDLTITLSINSSATGSRKLTEDSVFIYRYNSVSSVWEKLNTSETDTYDLVLTAKITESGLYAIFKPFRKASEEIVVYPNRTSLHKSSQDSIYIKGANISEIIVYSLDGLVVCRESPLKNRAFQLISHQFPKYLWIFPKKLFSPGLYTMFISYKNSSGEKKSTLRKIIVAP